MFVLLLGDVYVEAHLLAGSSERLVRLGGVFHAARALHALQCPFAVGCFSPSYLMEAASTEANHLGCEEFHLIGTVECAPNLVLVDDPSESCSPGYDVILREERRTKPELTVLQEVLKNSSVTDVLIFPSPHLLEPVLEFLAGSAIRTHIDVHYDVPRVEVLGALQRPFDTVFCSTSASLFRERWRGSVQSMCSELIPRFTERTVLKENRGGSRLFSDKEARAIVTAPAHIGATVHSVGVGDCFDAVFLERSQRVDLREALAYASYIAGQYARTRDSDTFLCSVSTALGITPDEMTALAGVALPWEERSKHDIYVAAPDFENVDREPLEKMVAALEYHNFRVRLPVREHGIVRPDDPPERKDSVFQADLDLLNACSMLIAVLLYNDPGTLVEIGLAAGMGKPTIVYDPYHIAENLMLCKLPTFVASDPSEIICSVYEQICALSAREDLHNDE